MICPRCNSNLAISNTQGIEIDHCPTCKGVWLDRGELEKIIERSVSNSSPSYHSESNHSGDKYHDKHHDSHNRADYSHQKNSTYHSNHKKNFLSDLFDF